MNSLWAWFASCVLFGICLIIGVINNAPIEFFYFSFAICLLIELTGVIIIEIRNSKQGRKEDEQ